MTYRADTGFLTDLFLSIDIDLVEADIGELASKLLKYGRDYSAWATPGCPEVDDNGFVTVNL